MPRGARVGSLIVTGLCALLGSACGGDETAVGEAGPELGPHEVAPVDARLVARLPAGATPEMAEEGRKLFAVCAACHGLDARGTQLGPSLRDSEWSVASHDLAEIERVIRDGVPEPGDYPIPMPVMGGGDYTPEQLRALSVYVYAIAGDDADGSR